MTERSARTLAWTLWAIAMVLAVGSVVFLALSWSTPPPEGTFGFRGFAAIFVLAFSTVGALVASRQPSNPIGWLMLVAGILSGVQELAFEYGIWAVLSQQPTIALGEVAAWMPAWIWMPGTSAAMFILLLFPDGRLLSPRWRWAVGLGLVATAIGAIGFALTPGPLENFGNVDNPFGIGTRDTTIVVAFVGETLYGIGYLLAAVSVGLRFHRSTGDERQQMKWLVASAGLLVFTFVLSLIRQATNAAPGASEGFGASLLVIAGFSSLPIAMGFAILKYRLYEIDVVIRKTVVFVILVALIMVIALGLLLALSGPLTAIAPDETQAVGLISVAIGISVWPLRRRAIRIADRVVFRGRADPYEVVSAFAGRVGETFSTEDVLPRMAQVVGTGTGATRARVWIRFGDVLRAGASWPDDDHPADVALDGDQLPTTIDAFASEVRHQGELLGALPVAMPPSDPINPKKESLVRDLASQAGLVLRNVRLLEELRESRRRIVTAQDVRARKLERDIHDGAQQQLVALAVKLRLLEQATARDPSRAQAMAAELQTDANDALENLRDLARGIYPPLLADRGLAAALEAQARKATLPVEVHSDGIDRFTQELEAAVYFSVLEALQNTAKYAGATRADVTLSSSGGELLFDVTDDGQGFKPEEIGYGTGLQGIEDRLAALGGTLAVTSAPGAGTRIEGRLPAEAQG